MLRKVDRVGQVRRGATIEIGLPQTLFDLPAGAVRWQPPATVSDS